jgi:hypothetical protein
MALYTLLIFLATTTGTEHMALPAKHYATYEQCADDKREFEKTFHNIYGEDITVAAFCTDKK